MCEIVRTEWWNCKEGAIKGAKNPTLDTSTNINMPRLDVLEDMPAAFRSSRSDGYRRRTWLGQMSTCTLDARLTPLLERRLSPSLRKQCAHILLMNANPPGDVSTALQLAHRLFCEDEVRANANCMCVCCDLASVCSHSQIVTKIVLLTVVSNPRSLQRILGVIQPRRLR